MIEPKWIRNGHSISYSLKQEKIFKASVTMIQEYVYGLENEFAII